MEIILADTAGFCFGVNRAVNKVEELLSDGKKVATLGPLIHNPQYIQSLCDRGAVIVDSPDEVPKNCELVIRAHGITKQLFEEVKEAGISYSDATCPFVMKIQKIIDKHSTEDNIVLIAGDENHPEVKGFRSYCKGQSFVFIDSSKFRSSHQMILSLPAASQTAKRSSRFFFLLILIRVRPLNQTKLLYRHIRGCSKHSRSLLRIPLQCLPLTF